MKQVIVFNGCVIKDDKILLVERVDGEFASNPVWELPGGRSEFGETAEQAVEREVREEAKVKITVGQLLNKIYTFNSIKETEETQIFVLGYLCQYIKEIKAQNDPEVGQIQWFEQSEVSELETLQGTKELANEAFKLMSNS